MSQHFQTGLLSLDQSCHQSCHHCQPTLLQLSLCWRQSLVKNSSGASPRCFVPKDCIRFPESLCLALSGVFSQHECKLAPRSSAESRRERSPHVCESLMSQPGALCCPVSTLQAPSHYRGYETHVFAGLSPALKPSWHVMIYILHYRRFHQNICVRFSECSCIRQETSLSKEICEAGIS